MTITVIGAIDQYQWKNIEYWWKSLLLSGYGTQEKVHLLTYRIHPETTHYLNYTGIVSHPCIARHPQVVINRFLDLAAFANTREPMEWIVCADVGDLVFQTNPREYLEKLGPEIGIVVASEGITFQDNRWARNNLIASFPKQFDEMKGVLLYNAGSFAARAGILANLAAEVYDMCQTNWTASNHDQAALNILLQKDYYGEKTLFLPLLNRWCFNGASTLYASDRDARGYKGRLPSIRNGRCYFSKDELVCMFHHYTRDHLTRKYTQRWIDRAWESVGELT